MNAPALTSSLMPLRATLRHYDVKCRCQPSSNRQWLKVREASKLQFRHVGRNLLRRVTSASSYTHYLNTFELSSGEVKRSSGAGVLGSEDEEVEAEVVDEVGGGEELTSGPFGLISFPKAFLPN